MSDPASPNGGPGTGEAASIVPSAITLPPELQNLSGEAKAEVYSLIASISLRSLTGPDPETARIAAQSEMHEETV